MPGQALAGGYALVGVQTLDNDEIPNDEGMTKSHRIQIGAVQLGSLSNPSDPRCVSVTPRSNTFRDAPPVQKPGGFVVLVISLDARLAGCLSWRQKKRSHRLAVSRSHLNSGIGSPTPGGLHK